MKTGQTNREFETNKTYWVAEGFSEVSDCPVYPHSGWSWTEWKPTITDTYKSFEDAKGAISEGYLKDMISTQKIVDIKIFEVTVTQKITENRVVNSYALSGKAEEYQEPKYVTSVGSLSSGDFLVLGNDLYGEVIYVRNGLMGISIINGGWKLVLDIKGDEPIVDVSSKNVEHMHGKPVEIVHIGVPDSSFSSRNYTDQLNAYHEKFDQNVLTSTLKTASQ